MRAFHLTSILVPLLAAIGGGGASLVRGQPAFPPDQPGLWDDPASTLRLDPRVRLPVGAPGDRDPLRPRPEPPPRRDRPE